MGETDSQSQLYDLSETEIIGADPWLETRLDHPEDVAVATDGTLYAGGENGQLYRIDPATNHVETIANTGGFVLGVTLGPDGDLYTCDFQQHAVFQLPLDGGDVSGELEPVVTGDRETRPCHPNYCVFDPDGRLYISDSGDRSDMANAGGCLYVVDSEGISRVLTDKLSAFPNGLALSTDGTQLYVAETGTHDVSVVEISDGKVQGIQFVTNAFGTVDGLGMDRAGRLYAASIGDNAVYRLTNPEAPPREQEIECLVRDPDGLTIGNPTNIAFGGPDDRTLYVANLGLWHLTKIKLDANSQRSNAYPQRGNK